MLEIVWRNPQSPVHPVEHAMHEEKLFLVPQGEGEQSTEEETLDTPVVQ
jgi:hypothetical protein